jgi:hypothetical protein
MDDAEVEVFPCCAAAGADALDDDVTTHETGWARAWLSASTPGMSTGYESGRWTREGDEERRVEGKAREDRYVEAVRNRSLTGETFIYLPPG